MEKLKIAISSGKGGTGKTFISTNIAWILSKSGKKITYLDCDVEEPNGHLFLKPEIEKEEEITLFSPYRVNENKCIKCGKCVDVCNYNAIAMIKKKILFFPELCHSCGACKVVCPVDAIEEKEKKIGQLLYGKSGEIDVYYALLETAEGGMSPRLVKKVKENIKEGINILDSPPGTSCPVVETVRDTDLVVLVTDPTPFGINDLKLAVEMTREIGKEPVVIVNRAEYMNDDLKNYCGKEEIEIIGEIPDDIEIAKLYSKGEIVVEKNPDYRKLFEELSKKIVEIAGKERKAKRKIEKTEEVEKFEKKMDYSVRSKKAEEIVIISGKGGTGKTSIVASFAALSENSIFADCDVDAADLHLILKPEVVESGFFSGSVKVEIEKEKCAGCGKCYDVCRFSAIKRKEDKFEIDPIACEGCGTCFYVCEFDAIKKEDAINGKWFVSETRFGPMSHAKLGVAEENSGKLVTLVRNKCSQIYEKTGRNKAIVDGAPGTGCPVISSLTGADFAVIVTEPTVSGIHDFERVLKVIFHFGIPCGVIVNKYDLNEEMTEKIEDMAKNYGIFFLGKIPYDKEITYAQIKGLSVVEFSNGDASESIRKIWEKLNYIMKRGRGND